MTAHELARKLLEMPDYPVTHMEWSAGTDQWKEIESVKESIGDTEDEEGYTFGTRHIIIS